MESSKSSKKKYILILSFLIFSFFVADFIKAKENYWNLSLYKKGVVGDIPRPPKPFFWQAATEVEDGFQFSYEKLFYTNRYFSGYYGFSFALWGHNNRLYEIKNLAIISSFLSARVPLFVTNNFQTYFYYSIGGPSLLSHRHFMTARFSNRFVFRDVIGVGVSFMDHPQVDLSLRLLHYSNADIFPINTGIDVPVAMSLGLNL